MRWILFTLMLLLAACGAPVPPVALDGGQKPPHPAPVTTAADGTEATTQPPNGDLHSVALHLYVSNQSFRVDPVDITVTIDDQVIVDQDFVVGSQHNWVEFDVTLAKGSHQLVATARNGSVVLRKTLRLPAERWAVINYWNYAGDPEHLTWMISKDPVAFG